MKKFSFILGLTVLVVSFQNCAGQKSSVTSDTVPLISSEKTDAVLPAGNFENMVLWDPEHQQYLDLDLKTGNMVAYEDYGHVRGERYCLTAADLSEVKIILSNSEVCIPAINYDEVKDRICTTLYKFPYVSLVANNQEYRLGEMTSGCDKPTDLCGDRGTLLRNFSTSILRGLASKTCPQ